MIGPLSIYDFILIDDKFDDIREPMSILIQKYNKTNINYAGISELLENYAYDDFINGDYKNSESVYITVGLLKEPIDLKLSIIENIYRIADVDICTSVRPLGYDHMLGLLIGLQSIYDASN